MAVYALGSNGAGQLGIGHAEDVSCPTAITQPLNPHQFVRKIVAGGNHTLMLLSDNTLRYSGANHDGRCLTETSPTTLDASNQDTADSFRALKLNCEQYPSDRIIHCAATWEASIAVLESGHLIASGTGTKGELGLGSAITQSRSPRIIPDFPPPGTMVCDISACMTHVVVVLSNGQVYGWGAGRKGQLGLPVPHQWRPRLIEGIPFRASRVACGKEFTYIAGAPSSGEHMVLGSDKWSVIRNMPALLPMWQDVGASWGSIFVLTQDGKIVSWGRNDHKQLAPKHLAGIRQMAIGSEHALCITSADEVVAWGWGEHGNCGLINTASGFDSGGDVVVRSSALHSVGAGCATSWVVTKEPLPHLP